MTPDMLDVVSVYDNPMRWNSRRQNFLRFERFMMDAGVRLTTVELAHGERPFELADTEGVRRVRLRANDLIWRKENLTRIGFASIPDWKYGAAIDGDMFFHVARDLGQSEGHWAIETLHALQHYRMVQMSSTLIWLGPKHEIIDTAKSQMFWYQQSRQVQKADKYYHSLQPIEMLQYGYTGGAWAYRREAYEAMGELLDICILGAADFHMGYAILGLPDLLLSDNDYTMNYRDALVFWKNRAVGAIEEDVGLVPLTMYHMWHGPLKARRYSTREQILIRNHFRPDEDLVRDRNGLLHLAGNKPRLRDDIREYFAGRNEDSVDV